MSKKRLTDMEQLIKDYHRDNQRIQIMRIAWLPAEEIMKGRGPKGNQMRNLPTKSQMRSMEDEPADGSQGDQHKNKPSNNKPIDPKAKASRSEKSSNSSSSKEMSPARQIMKAVTKLALNPKHKSVKKDVMTKGELHQPGARSGSKAQSAQGKIRSNGEKLKTKVSDKSREERDESAKERDYESKHGEE